MEIGGRRRGHPTKPSVLCRIFFFFQRVCMNGLLITHQADIILISPALIYIFFVPLGLAHWSLRGKYG